MRYAATLIAVFGLGLGVALGLRPEHADADLLPPPTVPTATVPSVTVPVPPVTTVTTPPVTTPSPPPLPPPPPAPAPPPVSVPSVTTPSVTTPRVTTPVATTPTATVPSVTTPQASTSGATSAVTSAASSAVRAATSPRSGAPTAGASTGFAGTAGGGSSSSSGGGTISAPLGAAAGGRAGTPGSISGAAGAPVVSTLHTSRPWIGKGKQRRATTLTFVLRHGTRVTFTVLQVAPVCRTVGRFAVQAHKGVNRVPFTGRVGRRRLAPGTYYLEGRTASGQIVQRVTLVVVNAASLSKRRLEALRAANVCPTTTAFTAANPFLARPFFTGGAASAGGSAAPEAVSRSVTPEPEASGLGGGSSSTGRVLASAVENTARVIRPALVALLGISILLLALASLPPAFADARLNYALARHRTQIAAFGAAAFVAVAISFLVS